MKRFVLLSSLPLLLLTATPAFSQTTSEELMPMEPEQAVQEQPQQEQGIVAPQPVQTVMPSQSAPASTEAKKATPSPAKAGRKRAVFSMNAESEALKMTDDISTAKQQAKAHPDDPEAHFLLAAAYSKSPYLDKAVKEISKVKQMLKEKKDFEFIDRKLAEYQDLLQSRPNDSVILYRLALANFLKGYSVEKYPHHYKNGPTGSATSFYQQAQNYMNQVISLNPNDYYARNYLGYLVSNNGTNYARSIPIWEQSLKINDSDNVGAYLLLSEAYMKKGDLAKALMYGARGMEIRQRVGSQF